MAGPPRLAAPEHRGHKEIPAGPAPLPRRVVAGILDLAVCAAPLAVGGLIVSALGDDAGGGQADRAVFGAFALVITVVVTVWNVGHKEGRTGQSAGKKWTGLVVRDTDTGQAIGSRHALRRRSYSALAFVSIAGLLPSAARPAGTTWADARTKTEVVRESTATADGFIARERDISVRALRRARLVGLLTLVLILVAVALASVAIGARPLTLAEVHHALVTPSGLDTDIVVRTLRVPRTLLAIAVGIAIGVAGALIQGHTRNPLADPGLLGVNAGAAFAVVLSVYLLGLSSPLQFIWFAFLGALVASVAVFSFASIGRGGASPLTLPLAGVAVGAFLMAMTNAIVLLDRASLDAYRFWNVGSVAGRGFDVLIQVLPFLALGVVLALASTPALNLLSLGEDVARSLGTNIALNRTIGILAITLLTGAATAACGMIAFLGLVVPHIARAITGPDYRWLVPFSGLCGAIMLLTADVVGRVVVRPGELQIGIVLALIGGPFFIALVRRRKLVTL
ncbi:iron chelate uptake ABC transporter family permease subunit [Hoyosella sp. YIM 151337]|uniref:iron chelate uptake ABC transporter family permease subunit n=1 Tax=Hoyosella sp. YIM 151337 TaxID=2992742 RepID=UPI0022361040|nr:iron chelate uptake ABC transporter family permease subunit [Hoyosella sp. YIM 151337]MCW4354481.1 iron chelate uptake ABC transporter family permease subunit [Hoyosella sp. YIM 151337]